MDPLQKALGDISSIRRQVARTTEFRGYGPATLAATGALALGAAAIQAIWLPNPEGHLSEYLRIWTTVALVCAALAGAQMFTRTRRMHSSLSNEMIRMALEQFLPSVVAGALITIVIVRSAPASAWMLPGIWQIIFSLGIFASCRFLPRPMAVAGFWYLATGLACIAMGESQALSPWLMGVPYATGQILIAAILLFTSKEIDDEI